LTEHDFIGAKSLQVIRFAYFAGQCHDVVAARGKDIDREAADAAGGAADDDRTVCRLQAVFFHAHNAEPGGVAGGAERHRFGPAKPGREHVHPGGGNTRALGIAAVVGDADVVTGCEDFITRLEAGSLLPSTLPARSMPPMQGKRRMILRRRWRPAHPCS
jgi:hypothetical protein